MAHLRQIYMLYSKVFKKIKIRQCTMDELQHALSAAILDECVHMKSHHWLRVVHSAYTLYTLYTHVHTLFEAMHGEVSKSTWFAVSPCVYIYFFGRFITF